MHKLIGPSNLVSASRWYLTLLRGVARGVTFDEFLELMASTPDSNNIHYAHNPSTTRAQLSRLVKTGFVEKSGTKRSLQFSISPSGLEQLKLLSFLEIKPASNYHWDQHWRLVMFDIPENSRKSRNVIRHLLQQLGFRQLQLSVWASPLPCLDQFEQLTKAYEIGEHIFLIETLHFNPPQTLLKHFQKTYPGLGICALK